MGVFFLWFPTLKHFGKYETVHYLSPLQGLPLPLSGDILEKVLTSWVNVGKSKREEEKYV